jgi:serine protease Do
VSAIGNALDLGIIMTGGWISRLNVSITYSNNLQLNGLIETDAVINPGNSGGPLVTTDGALVGMTNAALIQTPTAPDVEGIYYAISIDSAMPTIQSLISQLP